ncbi:MAG: AMP-binding protein [Reyranellaceae bacterium]
MTSQVVLHAAAVVPNFNPDTITAGELLAGLPARLHAIYEPIVRSAPEHVAFIEGSTVWTYGAFAAAVDAVAADFERLGIRAGDRLVIASENSVAAAAFVMAASKLDAWAIVANPRLSARELDQINEHSGARRRFFMGGVSSEAAAHAERCGAVTGSVGPFAGIGVGELNTGARPEPVHQDGRRQVAVLIYTSGTTGAPKGVMLSHENLLFAARVTALMRGLSPDDRIYGVLPMSHIVGLSIGLVATMLFGATNVAVAKYDPAHLAATLEVGGASVVYGVPATYQRLLAHKLATGRSRLGGGRLRAMTVAGAPLDMSLKRRVEEEFGLPLVNGYGITECSPSISGVRADDPRPDETVGRIVPGVETRVVRPDGTTVAPGDVGELHVRGPNVMLGYYRAKDLTDKAVDSEGWFATGDLVRFDGAYLYVVGRAKEMIIRSGFNVYPAEVEAVINEHPAVLQSAVVGRAVDGNEEVIAFVQLVPAAATTVADLQAFVHAQLTPYKRPSEIVILDVLPAGSTGKILKHVLKERAAAMRP